MRHQQEVVAGLAFQWRAYALKHRQRRVTANINQKLGLFWSLGVVIKTQSFRWGLRLTQNSLLLRLISTMVMDESLPSNSLTPKEVAKLIQFDATASGQPTDVYYAFLFALYTGLLHSELDQMDGERHLAMSEMGLTMHFGVRNIPLDEVADGAPGTICDLYNGLYGLPFFGSIPSRIFLVKLKGLFKEIGVTRKLTIDDGFARRTGIAYYQSLGISPEEMERWVGAAAMSELA